MISSTHKSPHDSGGGRKGSPRCQRVRAYEHMLAKRKRRSLPLFPEAAREPEPEELPPGRIIPFGGLPEKVFWAMTVALGEPKS